jgi:hypothetical protein
MYKAKAGIHPDKFQNPNTKFQTMKTKSEWRNPNHPETADEGSPSLLTAINSKLYFICETLSLSPNKVVAT